MTATSASTSTLATATSSATVKEEGPSTSAPELSSELKAWVGAIPAELGASSARSYFADAGPEDSSSSSDEEDAAEVLPTDTEGEGDDLRMPGARVLVERDAEGVTSEEREAIIAGRKSSKSVGRSERIAGIPAKASPFGLMARMSTHKVRSRAGSPVREAEGIAGEDFFRAGKFGATVSGFPRSKASVHYGR